VRDGQFDAACYWLLNHLRLRLPADHHTDVFTQANLDAVRLKVNEKGAEKRPLIKTLLQDWCAGQRLLRQRSRLKRAMTMLVLLA
jgi:hypothetical protein